MKRKVFHLVSFNEINSHTLIRSDPSARFKQKEIIPKGKADLLCNWVNSRHCLWDENRVTRKSNIWFPAVSEVAWNWYYKFLTVPPRSIDEENHILTSFYLRSGWSCRWDWREKIKICQQRELSSLSWLVFLVNKHLIKNFSLIILSFS